jgi:hypothetical protein
MAEETYDLSAGQYRELMSKLGPFYAEMNDGKKGVITTGSTPSEAGENAEAAMRRDGQGATARVELRGNDFNLKRQRYIVTTSDNILQYELNRMGVQPMPQPSQSPKLPEGGAQQNERRP